MNIDAERKRELLQMSSLHKGRIDDTETMKELFGMNDDELHPYLAQSSQGMGDLPYQSTAFHIDQADDEDLTEYKFAKFAATYFQVCYILYLSFLYKVLPRRVQVHIGAWFRKGIIL